jgi:polysaccharide pyruvyl transferase WcaK-like protein
MNVYLINDTRVHPNWGSRATTYKLRQMLAAVSATVTASLPLERLAHLSWDDRPVTDKVKRNAYDLTNNPMMKKAIHIAFNQSRRFLSEVAPQRWQDFNRCAEEVMKGRSLSEVKENLQTCDVIVINGEGGIFGTQREARMMFFIAYLAKTYFQKPVVMVSHTADVRDPVLLEMARHVYPMLDDVVFREAQSLELCKPFVNGKLSADVTFDYQPAPYEAWLKVASQPGYFHYYPDLSAEFDPRQPYVCVGGSSIYFRKDRPAYNPVPAFTMLCKRLAEQTQVVLTASATPDLAIFEPIAKELNLPLIRPEVSPQQAVDLLGHASAYIGGRWHGGIFAATGGTPMLTLKAHTFKVDSLNQQLGLTTQPFNALALQSEIEPILKALEQQLSDPTMRVRLRNRARELGKLSWENVRFVKEAVKKRPLEQVA